LGIFKFAAISQPVNDPFAINVRDPANFAARLLTTTKISKNSDACPLHKCSLYCVNYTCVHYVVKRTTTDCGRPCAEPQYLMVYGVLRWQRVLSGSQCRRNMVAKWLGK
jgi:hypothetical protein